MAVKLVIAPEAALDIGEAYAWYETHRVGLGEEFLGSIDGCFARICREPEMFTCVHDSYRRALIRRFPYAVYYELAGSKITVYAVFHTSRDPAKWRQRLP
jgi:plasmid stabilization system protein ParE